MPHCSKQSVPLPPPHFSFHTHRSAIRWSNFVRPLQYPIKHGILPPKPRRHHPLPLCPLFRAITPAWWFSLPRWWSWWPSSSVNKTSNSSISKFVPQFALRWHIRLRFVIQIRLGSTLAKESNPFDRSNSTTDPLGRAVLEWSCKRF